jgi:hypothetical protein
MKRFKEPAGRRLSFCKPTAALADRKMPTVPQPHRTASIEWRNTVGLLVTLT